MRRTDLANSSIWALGRVMRFGMVNPRGISWRARLVGGLSVGAVALASVMLACSSDETAASVGADSGIDQLFVDAGVDDSSADMPDGFDHDDPDATIDPDEPDTGIDAGPKKGSIVQSPADCDAKHPTWIGGAIIGSDGRALNALIGVDHPDSAGNKVDADGIICGAPGSHCCGGYSFCLNPNPGIGADGTTDPAAVRTWGKCISNRVSIAFFEIYPKDPSGKTTLLRYGEAVHAYQPITPGKPNTIGLRLPQIYQVGNGNTGGVTGRVWCNDQPVAITDITRVRAWSNGKGPECGIEGYNASATSLTQVAGVTRYRIDYLAGGRCNAPSQNYRFYMDVNCGGVKKSLRQDGNISQGTDLALDWKF